MSWSHFTKVSAEDVFEGNLQVFRKALHFWFPSLLWDDASVCSGGLNTAFSHVYKPSDSNSCMPGDSNEPRMIVASERATVHFRGWSAATKRPGWTRKILELWFVLLCQVMNTNKDMCFCVLYTVSLPVSMFFLWRLCFWCPKQSKGALGGFRFVAERLQKWRNLVAQWWFDHRGIGPIRGRSWAFHTYIVV